MLRILPEWWQSFMVWLDTSTIPVWVMCLVFGVILLYCIAIVWRDLRAMRHDPPPYD